MIARIWHGMVPRSNADEYRDLMQTVALPDYQGTHGNRGAWCLYRAEADVAHFEMLTMWEDTAAIKRFAGDDYSKARYYDFDPGYLIEMEPGVQHYDVYAQHSPAVSGSVGERDDGEMIARVWKGVVPAEKTEAYSRYLAGFGFEDYKFHPGNLGIYLLRRTDASHVHLLLLSFWTSRDTLVSYAGADIDQAHYYPYDLECLINPAPTVEHYDVRRATTQKIVPS